MERFKILLSISTCAATQRVFKAKKGKSNFEVMMQEKMVAAAVGRCRLTVC